MKILDSLKKKLKTKFTFVYIESITISSRGVDGKVVDVTFPVDKKTQVLPVISIQTFKVQVTSKEEAEKLTGSDIKELVHKQETTYAKV